MGDMKRFFIGLLGLLFVGAGCVPTTVPTPAVVPIQPVHEQAAPEIAVPTVPSPVIQKHVPAPVPVAPSVPIAPNGTYTNVDGNEVPSPYYAPSAPAGASAECRDGTYSFSQHRSGTCSHHGGVAEWL